MSSKKKYVQPAKHPIPKEPPKGKGYTQTNFKCHGQPVFANGKNFISPDVDQHNGGYWKMAKSLKALGKKFSRICTCDENLTPFKE